VQSCKQTTRAEFARSRPGPFFVTSNLIESDRDNKLTREIRVIRDGKRSPDFRDAYQVLEVPADAKSPFIRVGRGNDCDICIDDESVSRVHVSLQGSKTGWRLIDLHSSAGTILNGERLKPGTPHPVTSGDTIQLGSLDLTFLDGGQFYDLVVRLYP
jgi:hypothetical protein